MVAEALALIGIALLVFVLLVTIYVATSRYKLAPSDKILVVYGNVKDKEEVQQRVITVAVKLFGR